MRIIDRCDLGEEASLFTVELDDGFYVDVKVCAGDGLVYVMQNEDGSTVYGGRSTGYTYPAYEYDENAVLELVKGALLSGDKAVHIKLGVRMGGKNE